MFTQPDDITADLKKLLMELGVTQQKIPRSKKPSELNKVLRRTPFRIPEAVFGKAIMFHRVAKPLTVGTDTTKFDVETKTVQGVDYVVPHGHGDANHPCGVSLA